MMKRTLIQVLAVTTVAAFAFSASAQTNLRFGHYGAPSDAVTKAAEKFKSLVEEKTGGSVTVTLYPGSSLGNSTAMVQGARMGTIDMACTGNPYFTSFAPVMNVIDLPFLFVNEGHVEKVMDGPIGRELLDKLDQYKLKGLALWEIGFRDLTNNARPVSKPADLKGLKIRTTPNPAHVQAFEMLGANPTPMPFSEVYLALETGIVDGQENPVHHIYANRLQEVQKYMSLTHHAYTASPVVMNLSKFNRLTAAEQKAILEAAVEAAKFDRSLNKGLNDESLELIKKAGVEVIENPDSAAFRAIVADATRASYVKEHGSAILDKIVAAGK